MYDNSQLQAYKDCPERYRLKYVEKLRKRKEGEESHDKNFGSAIHAGLEALYKGQPIGEAREAFKLAYPGQLNTEDNAKTQENGLLLLEAYQSHYKEEDKKWEIVSVEVKDTFQIAPGVDFTVKIDLVVNQQGCIYFVDHKTTGKTFNWTYWSRFEPNPQITAYTAYCQAKFGECSGGIINGIKLGFRTRAYKGEPAGFHYEFQRQLFNRNQDQVKAWKEDTLNWIKSLEESKSKGSNVWLKNEGQCGYCEYKAVCISCNDEQIIEQLYEVHNPEEYLNDNSGRNQVGEVEANA